MKNMQDKWPGTALAAIAWAAVGFIVALVTGTSMGYRIDAAYVVFVAVLLGAAFIFVTQFGRWVSDSAGEPAQPAGEAETGTRDTEPKHAAEAAS